MLTAQEPPKWEAKTRPRTGVREYQVEISEETFKKLLWVVKGKNAANQDSPDKLRVSGVAETALREWLDEQWPGLNDYWNTYEQCEMEAIGHVAKKAQP
jgi:hypothetical protein